MDCRSDGGLGDRTARSKNSGGQIEQLDSPASNDKEKKAGEKGYDLGSEEKSEFFGYIMDDNSDQEGE